MEIYKAIEFQKVLSKGGSTNPWLVEILVEESTKSFVVKVFKTDTLKQYNAVAHEVIANELASLLEMNVPEKAFIQFSDSFIKTLPKEQKELISHHHIDRRIKFGTAFIENAKIFSPTLQNILEDFEREDIYAFDNIILNTDRRDRKPNILFDPEQYFLIDHELCFTGIKENYVDEINNGNWNYLYKKHIFYKKLKEAKDKKYIFDNFEYSFTNLNIDTLKETFLFLEDHQHQYKEEKFLLDYLRFMQTNISKFKNILKSQVL